MGAPTLVGRLGRIALHLAKDAAVDHFSTPVFTAAIRPISAPPIQPTMGDFRKNAANDRSPRCSLRQLSSVSTRSSTLESRASFLSRRSTVCRFSVSMRASCCCTFDMVVLKRSTLSDNLLGRRVGLHRHHDRGVGRSEEHTSELQSLMRISYAVFCLKKKQNIHTP